MIADAHVHVGWFYCHRHGELRYFSPRRIAGIMERCGVEAFLISSTSAQADGITNEGLLAESNEVRRVMGRQCYQFLWVSWDNRENLTSLLDSGLYAGIKLHEKEGGWLESHAMDLFRVLDCVRERGLPVQFHSGEDPYCGPSALMKIARLYPER